MNQRATKCRRAASESEGIKPALLDALRAGVEADGLSQNQVAAVLEISQPKVSRLLSGKLPVSAEQLARLLVRLGLDVEVTITPKPRSRSAARFAVHWDVRPGRRA